MTLELVKRHDIFSLLLSLLDLSTTQDEVTLEIPMDDEMEPFIFAVLTKRYEKRIQRAHKDLKEHAKYKLVSKNLPDTLVAWTDCPELEGAFLREERVIRALNKLSDLVISIHITDEGSLNFSSSTKVLRCKFRIPVEVERTQTLVKLAIHFIDLAITHRLSAQARIRAMKERKKWADEEYRASHTQRQEALVQRKEEMKRREDEAAAEMSGVSRRKEPSKGKKRDQPRVKVIR